MLGRFSSKCLFHNTNFVLSGDEHRFDILNRYLIIIPMKLSSKVNATVFTVEAPLPYLIDHELTRNIAEESRK